jgi:hypothetical protein
MMIMRIIMSYECNRETVYEGISRKTEGEKDKEG